jgi:hypothetical protein
LGYRVLFIPETPWRLLLKPATERRISTVI